MLRYSSVLRSNAVRHREISYNQLTPNRCGAKRQPQAAAFAARF